MGEHGLIGGGVAKVLVLCKDVVQERSSAAPVAQDKEGVVLERLSGQFLTILAFLQSGAGAEQAADTLGKDIFCTFLGGDVLSAHNGLERSPVGPDQCVYGEFAKF